MSGSSLLTAFLLSLVICALYASVDFNRPSWASSYTSAPRYRCALGAYIVLYWLVFLIALSLLMVWLTVSSDHDSASGTEFSLAEIVWTASAITLCGHWVLSRPRRWLQYLAGIPRYAMRQAASLASGDLTPSEKDLKEARTLLLSRGIDTAADWLPPALPVYRLLERASALFVQLRAWDTDPRYGRFQREAKNESEMLRRRFERLSFRVSRALAIMDRLGQVKLRAAEAEFSQGTGPDIDPLIKKIVNDLITEVCEDIRLFYDDACLLATRGVLATRTSLDARKGAFAGLGFTASRPPLSLGYGVLVPAAVLLYAGVSLLFLILPPQVADINRKALGAVVSLTSFGALAIAIVPKLRWGFANAGLHERTPWRFILGAGLAATLFAMLVNLTTGALLHGIPGAVHRLDESRPWMFGIYMTAAAMAWLVQDNRWQNTSKSRKRRWRDALVFGSVWVLAALVGNGILIATGRHPAVPVDLLFAAVGSFVFGAIVGYVIPEWARCEPGAAMLSSPVVLSAQVMHFSPEISDL